MIKIEDVSVLSNGLIDAEELSTRLSGENKENDNISIIPINTNRVHAVDGSSFEAGFSFSRRGSTSMNLTYFNIGDKISNELNVVKNLKMLFTDTNSMYQFCISIGGKYFWGINYYRDLIDNLIVAVEEGSLIVRAIPGQHLTPSSMENLKSMMGSDKITNSVHHLAILSLIQTLDVFIKPLTRGTLLLPKSLRCYFYNGAERAYLDVLLKGSAIVALEPHIDVIYSCIEPSKDLIIATDKGEMKFSRLGINEYSLYSSEVPIESLIHLSQGAHETISQFLSKGRTYSPRKDFIKIGQVYRFYQLSTATEITNNCPIKPQNTVVSLDRIKFSEKLPLGILGHNDVRTCIGRPVSVPESLSDVVSNIMSHISILSRDGLTSAGVMDQLQGLGGISSSIKVPN